MSSKEDNGELYRQYLQQKHAKFNTPDEVINELVLKAVNSLPKSRERVILGENSEVYKVNTENDQHVVLRISRREDPRFATEEWAINESRRMGVPVPKILLVDNVRSNGEELDICIQEEIFGEIFSDTLSSYSESERREIVNKAGEILSKIHSVKTSGFGYLDSHGNGKYLSWKEFIQSLVGKEEKLLAAAERISYDTDKIRKALEILRNNMDVFEGIEARLLHSDYSPKHLFINNKEIVGVIDFEGCKGGDPIRDLVWWDYFWGDSLPVDWLVEGYLNKELFEQDSYKRRFELTKLHLGLGMFEYYEMENNEYGIGNSKKQLDKMLDNSLNL